MIRSQTARTSRRTFLKTAAAVAGAFSTSPIFFPNILAQTNPGKKLNCALIGCGGRGMTHIEAILNQKQNLIAIVDPDETRHAVALRRIGSNADKPEAFTDYRRMFDKIGKQLDAVFIAANNHHHAPASIIAMQLGKNVYCEKPLSHTIAEARKLSAMARAAKVATQMGNQGHCMEGFRLVCEYIWSGAIGKVTEVHSWTDRANGGSGPRPPAIAVPNGMHWDEWIGPAPYRDFHADLHPHDWHGWHDFGNGSIGNMGCHILDGAVWALKIEHPASVEAEQMRGGSHERCPEGCRIRWGVPARAEFPALKVYWYDGINETGSDDLITNTGSVKGDARNLPPLLLELRKQYPQETIDTGDGLALYVGDKGIIATNTYGRNMRLLPMAKMRETPPPPKTLPRSKDVFIDFIEACQAGKTETASPFEAGARLTEFCLLANLAQHAGVGKKIQWDGPNMNVVNLPELNQWVKKEPRKGWA
jgi:predicted dehydrogenase